MSLVANYIFATESFWARAALTCAAFGAGMALSLYVLPSAVTTVGLTGIQTLAWCAVTCFPPLTVFAPGVVVSYFGAGAMTCMSGVTSAMGAIGGAIFGAAVERPKIRL